MKWMHIIAGSLALASGMVAMIATKGSPLHRKSGVWFAVAMLVMTSTAVVIASLISPNRVNVVAGLLTFYLVSTGWLAVRLTVEKSRALLAGFMVLALAGSLYAFSLAAQAMGGGAGKVDGVPATPLLMFGVVGLLGASLDARLLIAGSIRGGHRLARHLWRMGFAMWIATASFFLGQARQFPAPIRKSGLLAIPVLLVIVFLVYWVARVAWKRHAAVRG